MRECDQGGDCVTIVRLACATLFEYLYSTVSVSWNRPGLRASHLSSCSSPDGVGLDM